jgi:hypothetical protein
MLIEDRLVSDGGWVDRKGVACFNLYRPPVLKPGDTTVAKYARASLREEGGENIEPHAQITYFTYDTHFRWLSPSSPWWWRGGGPYTLDAGGLHSRGPNSGGNLLASPSASA